MGNNAGKWDFFYEDVTERDHYIDTKSYKMGADWLTECSEVEDWGCGKGWFAKVAEDLNVISIDGSNSPFADKIVDLEDYTSNVEGVFMRSVAEHNFEWKKVLTNLAQSFTKRAFVEFYTPMEEHGEEATLIMMSPGWDNIPELSIPRPVWHSILKEYGITFSYETFKSDTFYGEETVYWLEK